MAGPDRREAPLSGIGGGELALAVTTGVAVGAVAALVPTEILLIGAGTLIAIEIGLLILEVVIVGSVVYFWPEEEITS